MASVLEKLSTKAVMAGLDTAATIAPTWTRSYMESRFFSPVRRAPRFQPSDLFRRAQQVQLPFRNSHLQGYIWRQNNPDAPTVFLVHGWEHEAIYMQEFVEPLLEQGYTVAAIDGPAHGNSGLTQTDLYIHAEAWTGWMDRFPGPWGIVAHSFGGASLLHHFITQPDDRLKSMVLVASPMTLAGVVHQTGEMMRLPARLRNRMAEAVVQRYGKPLDEYNFVHMVQQLPSLDLLYIQDTKDVIVPPWNGYEKLKDTPAIELMITTGLGHNRILTDPGVVQAATRHINRQLAQLPQD